MYMDLTLFNTMQKLIKKAYTSSKQNYRTNFLFTWPIKRIP